MAEKKTRNSETEEQKEKRLAYHRAYYARNKESMREKARQRRAQDPGKHREAFRKYYEQNKEALRETNRRREQVLQESTRETAAKRYSAWSQEEDDQVLASPLPAHKLATEMGRTYSSVAARRAYLRRLQKEREQEIVELAEEAVETAEPVSLED